MDIEKIKKYNQIMLAALGTTAIAFAIFGLLGALAVLAYEWISSRDPGTNALFSDKKVEQLYKDSLRQQIISYDLPHLVDTPNLIYIIPVSAKTLDNPENYNHEVLREELYDMDVSLNKKRKRWSGEYYSSFNNLVYFDYNKNLSSMICDKRLIGSNLTFEYFEDEIIAVFTGAESDTDKDGNITLEDFKSLFVYSFNDKKLRKIGKPNATVNSFRFVENKKDILIAFGLDRDKNNEFETETEPTVNLKYDYAKGQLSTLVDEGTENEIQKTIDHH